MGGTPFVHFVTIIPTTNEADVTRRHFCISAGSGALGRGVPAHAGKPDQALSLPLADGISLAVDDPWALMEAVARLGREYQDEHGGCARCTVAALQDALSFLPVNPDVLRAACCLDGGATPTKEANCGAFTGAGIVIGWAAGTDRFGDRTVAHGLINQVHDRFAAAWGGVLCKTVREAAVGDCPGVEGEACRWTTEIILDRFAESR